jgi:hypothetical protein
LQLRGVTWKIEVRRAEDNAGVTLLVDGQPREAAMIAFGDAGSTHSAIIAVAP